MKKWDFPTQAKPGDTPDTLGAVVRLFLSQPGPWLIITALTAAVVTRVVVGGWSWWDLVVVVALRAWWPFQEWLIHTFILHRRPTTLAGRTIDLANANKHRAHHRDPWRPELVFIPLFSLVPGIPFVALLCFVLTPSLPLALTAFAAHMTLTLHYEWVHTIAHTRWGSRSGPWTRVVKAHQLHHFKSEKYWMGVSMTFGDRVLGTAPAAADVSRSATVRTLGIVEPA